MLNRRLMVQAGLILMLGAWSALPSRAAMATSRSAKVTFCAQRPPGVHLASRGVRHGMLCIACVDPGLCGDAEGEDCACVLWCGAQSQSLGVCRTGGASCTNASLVCT